MTNPPDFSKLTPPHDVALQCAELLPAHAVVAAYRAGAQHGWQQARQLWPTPITDRPPTEADGDDLDGDVQWLRDGKWMLSEWNCPFCIGLPWQHTPRWRPPAPKAPTLREQALALLDPELDGQPLGPMAAALIRRALEGGEGEG